MAKYSNERKDHIIKQLLPPINGTVSKLSEKEGIPQSTLYNWRLRNQSTVGDMESRKNKGSNKWNVEQKLAVVVTTYSMTADELNVYCRENGLYPEQVKEWKSNFLVGQANAQADKNDIAAKNKEMSKTIKKLKKELDRKDKALAETAALLTLGKKYDALWSDKEES